MSARSRSKGKRGELLAAAALRELGIEAARAGYAGHSTEDLEHALRGVHIECKYQARPRISSAYQQAVRDAGEHVPVALTKQVPGGEPWLITLALGDIWRLVAALDEVRPR
jgi:hypothetical protein